jgi:hypothetical protein
VSGFSVYGNLLYRIGRYGIQIGGGRDNEVVNNVVVEAFPALVVDARWEAYAWTMNSQALQAVPYKQPPWSTRYPRLAAPMRNPRWPEGNEIRNNIFARLSNERCQIPLIAYSIPETATVTDGNLLWSPDCGVRITAKLLERGVQGTFSFVDWKAYGFDARSAIADPQFVDAANGDFSLTRSSPAFPLGFKPLSRPRLQLKQSETAWAKSRVENFDFYGTPK